MTTAQGKTFLIRIALNSLGSVSGKKNKLTKTKQGIKTEVVYLLIGYVL